MEFPHFEQMYRQLRSQGFELIAMTGFGGRASEVDTLDQMRRGHGITVPMALDTTSRIDADSAIVPDTTGAFARYRAGMKVIYILDSKGTIVYAASYDPKKFRETLGRLGVRWRDRKG